MFDKSIKKQKNTKVVSSAEGIPDDETTQELGDLISISFVQDPNVETMGSMEPVVLRSFWLGQSTNDFIEQQMAKYGILDDIVANHALESYKFLTEVVEDGGRIEVVDKFGHRYPVDDNLGKLPPAA